MRPANSNEQGGRRVAPLLSGLLVLAALGAAPPVLPAAAPDIAGRWDATVQVGTLQVPFQFGLSVDHGRATGWFYNGGQQVTSSSGSFDGSHLVLHFDSYAKRLQATLLADGTLAGAYAPTTVGSTTQPYAFHARRAQAGPRAAGKAPAIAGLWLVPAPSHKAGEQAWRFIVRQSGARIDAAILRVDGDTGVLTGTWRGGGALLSHFDGARPAVIEISAATDGELRLLVRDPHGKDLNLTAYRPEQAQALGLPKAADPTRHTRYADEPFQFSFPDLRGRLVSNTDARFRDKVLLVDIAGSWCPNCHDEAPFLESLYRKYHARGLEIVTLAFEDPAQYANPERLRAFVRQFGLTYTVLLAGTTDELHARLPQALDLDAYPTTFFIGRDGRVRAVHAGFASPATGRFNTQLKKEFTARIEELLAGRRTQRSAPL